MGAGPSELIVTRLPAEKSVPRALSDVIKNCLAHNRLFATVSLLDYLLNVFSHNLAFTKFPLLEMLIKAFIEYFFGKDGLIVCVIFDHTCVS